MGLRFTDLQSWQHWQASRRRLRVLKATLLRRDQDTASPELKWWASGAGPTILIACDSNSPTNHHSLVSPFSQFGAPDALLVQPAGVDLVLDQERWRPIDRPALDDVRTLISIGDHLPVGAWAHRQALSNGWREVMVQHGLLTPFSPPPPNGAQFLAWSEADAAFISEGRSDLSAAVTGSPLLAAAAANPAPHVSRFETPVFLGQLHGAELSRWSMTRSVTEFWKQTGATYRPHPREEDVLSRLQHKAWRRMGMQFDTSHRLAELDRPVVAAFSTGVVEALVRGVPSWVFHLNPPAWLEELWVRYGLTPWGEEPRSLPLAESEPSTHIVDSIQEPG